MQYWSQSTIRSQTVRINLHLVSPWEKMKYCFVRLFWALVWVGLVMGCNRNVPPPKFTNCGSPVRNLTMYFCQSFQSYSIFNTMTKFLFAILASLHMWFVPHWLPPDDIHPMLNANGILMWPTTASLFLSAHSSKSSILSTVLKIFSGVKFFYIFCPFLEVCIGWLLHSIVSESNPKVSPLRLCGFMDTTVPLNVDSSGLKTTSYSLVKYIF